MCNGQNTLRMTWPFFLTYTNVKSFYILMNIKNYIETLQIESMVLEGNVASKCFKPQLQIMSFLRT